MKHPVEIGSNNQKLKLIHPETEHSKGYGLTLENHSESKSHIVAHDHHDLGAAAGGEEGHGHHEVYEIPHEYDFSAYEAEHH